MLTLPAAVPGKYRWIRKKINAAELMMIETPSGLAPPAPPYLFKGQAGLLHVPQLVRVDLGGHLPVPAGSMPKYKELHLHLFVSANSSVIYLYLMSSSVASINRSYVSKYLASSFAVCSPTLRIPS